MFAVYLSNGVFGDKFHCWRCEENPNLKKAWGCEKKAITMVPVLKRQVGETEYRYWRCPQKMITWNVIEFINMLDYSKEFNAPMPPYNSLSRRFKSALAVYKKYTSEALSTK